MAPFEGAFASMVAPVSWHTIDFISDLHLAGDTPRTFQTWADYLRDTSADAVLILGDLFEAWVGDDARLAGFEARGAAVLADAACRRTVGFMVGNRDFLLGSEMLEACGVLALSDPTALSAFGETVLLTHGDAMCVDDLDYQQFRGIVRSDAWRADFLRRPLEERRAMARTLRAESEQRKTESAPCLDVDRATAVAAMRHAAATTLVHGHTHRPGSEALAPGYQRHVLSDWDADHGPNARGEVLRWQATGFTRLAPGAAVAVAER